VFFGEAISQFRFTKPRDISEGPEETVRRWKTRSLEEKRAAFLTEKTAEIDLDL